MSWNSGMTKLRNILAELYPTVPLSRQVVAQAGLPPQHIAFNPAATSNWHAILEQAALRKRVSAIVAVASEEYPEQKEVMFQAEQEHLNLSEGAAKPTPEPRRDPNAREVLIELREILAKRFSLSELKALCFDLDVDYEDLSGGGKSGKALELVNYCKRRRMIPKLIATGQIQRSDISWPLVS